MIELTRRMVRGTLGLSGIVLALAVGLNAASMANADETHAKTLLKAMSDYLAAQQAISFGFDTTWEVVTQEDQKLALASSGTVVLNRPDKLRATRAGGFADIELLFEGKTLTVLASMSIATLRSRCPAPSII